MRKLICALLFAYGKNRFSHDVAHLSFYFFCGLIMENRNNAAKRSGVTNKMNFLFAKTLPKLKRHLYNICFYSWHLYNFIPLWCQIKSSDLRTIPEKYIKKKFRQTDTRKKFYNYPLTWTVWFYVCPEADRMANSVDPEQVPDLGLYCLPSLICPKI